jgi:hypothetical protein
MVDYPAYNNDILIHLDTPYQYNGNNLVVMFKRPWIQLFYIVMEFFAIRQVM